MYILNWWSHIKWCYVLLPANIADFILYEKQSMKYVRNMYYLKLSKFISPGMLIVWHTMFVWVCVFWEYTSGLSDVFDNLWITLTSNISTWVQHDSMKGQMHIYQRINLITYLSHSLISRIYHWHLTIIYFNIFKLTFPVNVSIRIFHQLAQNSFVNLFLQCF